MGWPLLSTHVCDVKLTSCLCGYLRALSQDKLEKQIDPVVCKAEDLASQLLVASRRDKGYTLAGSQSLCFS